MPVDGRSKLDPPLPHEYFGNAIFYATSISMFGNLRSESLMDTAERVHKAMKRMDDEYLRSAIDYVEETLTQQQPAGLASLVIGRNTYKSPNLGVNKWSRFPVQDANSGWGSPYFMGLARASLKGMMLLLPNTTNDGSSWLSVCLKTCHLQLFKEFLYDFDQGKY
ncbi:hypothetical protein JRO89_XS06G0128400 [Xanthoceras sorbifolium]|uniref:Uncharacterized protein n=1 Tax=Xanthoceras sorbifolium TaxID=99658 RepID=A0ABQ8HY11_9ROSI|nr:hypothetical protein JRO89_XS06G0128400 [Xanthoceras sorbifolium]